jgi:hypothetical protein
MMYRLEPAIARFARSMEAFGHRTPMRACGYQWTTKLSCLFTNSEPGPLSFHVCSRCGVVPVVTCRLNEKMYAVVNVNTFTGFDSGVLRHAPASFEGEELESRLSRRARNWISDVQIVAREA